MSNIKFHRNQIQAVTKALNAIFGKNAKADDTVQRLLKSQKRWGSRDRRLVAGSIYDIVRYKRKYEAVAADLVGRTDHETLFWIWAAEKGYALPDWAEIKELDTEQVQEALNNVTRRTLKESIPDWLDNLGVEELGEERWERELHVLNQEADVILRVNTLLTYPERLQQWLKEEGVETEKIHGFPDALRLKKRRAVQHLKAFKLGHFEIQDANSQMIAPLVDPQEGDFIVDACAGAGGKSLHLAALLKDQGEILAIDIYPKKMYELEKRARRSRIEGIRTLLADKNTDFSEYSGKADKVLIDAPCSGLGILRRNPDAKWKLSMKKIQRYRELQQDILQSYAPLVKAGGSLVYATCSILPSENGKQVREFLSSEAGAGFELTEEYTLWPSVTGFDGFYVGQMIRK
ncbi:MAG: RsmB/NOP family class I SAM-dependent RNA methyltransferase [Bacteroidia bacterium]|nr:RsmB/NOP family class I SAM-dependent RNA methyltransferase [Bacteroidia bacterium]